MNKVIKQIEVDVYTPTFYEVIKAQQGDKNSRFVEFILFNQGEPYILSDDAIVKLEGQRPNKSPVMKPCTVTDSIISVELDADLLYYHGISHLKVVLYASDENTVLSTIPFTLSVQKNPLDSDKFEKDNYSLLNELILSAEQNIKDLQNHLSNEDAHGYDTKISNEIKRASDTEKGLSDDILQETSEREKADKVITNQLNSEITRATSVENNLTSAKADKNLIGSANGIAELDASGKVPSSQLPSFVDDVIEGYFYDNKFYQESSHTTEITGESSKIYTDLLTNKIYRWSGSNFVIVSETLALGETSSTAYRGDRGKIAYEHSQTPHVHTKDDIGLGNVDNTADVDKRVKYADSAGSAEKVIKALKVTYNSPPEMAVYDGSEEVLIDIPSVNNSTATQSENGLMSASDKKKLDGIASGANAYSLPLASASARGGVKTGYTANGKNYPVQLTNEQMYVNVPWTNTDTWKSNTKDSEGYVKSGNGQYDRVWMTDTNGNPAWREQRLQFTRYDSKTQEDPYYRVVTSTIVYGELIVLQIEIVTLSNIVPWAVDNFNDVLEITPTTCIYCTQLIDDSGSMPIRVRIMPGTGLFEITNLKQTLTASRVFRGQIVYFSFVN